MPSPLQSVSQGGMSDEKADAFPAGVDIYTFHEERAGRLVLDPG